MTVHNMALTYKPKIDPVRRNECKQTIRTMRKRPIVPGDIIKFHGWMDKAYKSPWTSRKAVVVKEVIPIIVHEDGIAKPYVGTGPWISGPVCHWWDSYCDYLAKLDYIYPATGEALRDVLFGLNGVPNTPQEYQIIQWKVI